jgi:poly-gamma-glutamate capsule biosynthesis protein CapA/YwtB (metallophosphatase superfamily)
MFFIIFFSFLRLFFVQNDSQNTWYSNTTKKQKPCADSILTFSIAAVGDLMCHSSQYQYAKQSNGTYNFNPVYAGVKNYLNKADFTVGNIETVLAADTKDFSGYPAFNTPNEYADALKEIGFDLLFTANNHSYDRNEKGVLRTLTELQKRNFVTIGTHKDTTDRDSVRMVDIKGIKIAFLGYTQFSNIPVPSAKKYLVNLIDTTLLKKDVIQARKKGAELVIVNFHWGNEYKQPTDYQKQIAQFAQKIGVDIILGEHPHVLQPLEKFKTENTKLDSGIVAYSLGNFFSSQQWRYSDAGVILTLKITKNLCNNTFKISGLGYLPTWVFKGVAEKNQKAFFIFPAEIGLHKDSIHLLQNVPPEIKFLQKAQWDKMKQAAEDTEKVLQNYGVKIKRENW